MIYEYALTEPDGLYFRWQGGRNPPRNCSPFGCKNEFHMYPSLDAALSAKDSDGTEANQLKYVCKQLYSETTGLGLKFNDLHFVRKDITVPPSERQFEHFIEHCTPRKLSLIRGVVLSKTEKARREAEAEFERYRQQGVRSIDWRPSEALNAIGRLCPKATIQCELPPMDRVPDPDHRVNVAVAIDNSLYQALRIRGVNSEENLAAYSKLRYYMRHRRSEYMISFGGTNNAANVRYTVPEWRDITEEDIRNHWLGEGKRIGKSEEELEKWTDDIVREFKEWIKHGL